MLTDSKGGGVDPKDYNFFKVCTQWKEASQFYSKLCKLRYAGFFVEFCLYWRPASRRQVGIHLRLIFCLWDSMQDTE